MHRRLTDMDKEQNGGKQLMHAGISVESQAVWIQINSLGPDLGPNCLQRLLADDTRNESSRESDSSAERSDLEPAENHDGKRKCVPNIDGNEDKETLLKNPVEAEDPEIIYQRVSAPKKRKLQSTNGVRSGDDNGGFKNSSIDQHSCNKQRKLETEESTSIGKTSNRFHLLSSNGVRSDASNNQTTSHGSFNCGDKSASKFGDSENTSGALLYSVAVESPNSDPCRDKTSHSVNLPSTIHLNHTQTSGMDLNNALSSKISFKGDTIPLTESTNDCRNDLSVDDIERNGEISEARPKENASQNMGNIGSIESQINSLPVSMLSQMFDSADLSDLFELDEIKNTLCSSEENMILPHVTGMSATKEWHQSVIEGLRDEMVSKFVEVILPTPDALKDKRMIKLVQYARKVEGDIYKTANSRDEYYHLLAEKLFKIHKGLDVRIIRRHEQQNVNMASVNIAIRKPKPMPPNDKMRPNFANVCRIDLSLDDAETNCAISEERVEENALQNRGNSGATESETNPEMISMQSYLDDEFNSTSVGSEVNIASLQGSTTDLKAASLKDSICPSFHGCPHKRTADEPHVQILEQPRSRGYRFRYEREGKTAGCIMGESSTPGKNTYPTIKICGLKGRAVIVVSCVDKDSPFKPHPHRLVGDSCKQGVCTVLNRSGDTVTFKSIGIQRAKRSNVKDYINERKNIRVDPYRTGEKDEMLKLLVHSVREMHDQHRGPKCERTKSLLEHMKTCTKARFCRVRNCWRSKVLLHHWKNCKSKHCRLCNPIRDLNYDECQDIDLNVVRLCFQVFLPDCTGKFTRIIQPVVTQPIYDTKKKLSRSCSQSDVIVIDDGDEDEDVMILDTQAINPGTQFVSPQSCPQKSPDNNRSSSGETPTQDASVEVYVPSVETPTQDASVEVFVPSGETPTQDASVEVFVPSGETPTQDASVDVFVPSGETPTQDASVEVYVSSGETPTQDASVDVFVLSGETPTQDTSVEVFVPSVETPTQDASVEVYVSSGETPTQDASVDVFVPSVETPTQDASVEVYVSSGETPTQDASVEVFVSSGETPTQDASVEVFVQSGETPTQDASVDVFVQSGETPTQDASVDVFVQSGETPTQDASVDVFVSSGETPTQDASVDVFVSSGETQTQDASVDVFVSSLNGTPCSSRRNSSPSRLHKVKVLPHERLRELLLPVWEILQGQEPEAIPFRLPAEQAYPLCEFFKSKLMTKVMRELGYCCGIKYTFTPQPLTCHGCDECSIARDTIFHSYQLRYSFCEHCFNLPGKEVELAVDGTQSPRKIPKIEFKKYKNLFLNPEQFVDCEECGRQFHKICVLHFEAIWKNGFICDNCLQKTGRSREVNRFTAQALPRTKLSCHLENHINALLKEKGADNVKISIRVLSNFKKTVEVKPKMKERFVDKGEMAGSFPYTLKSVFAFQQIDGVDICFFGMYVHEYGSECPHPNARRVYISYLDSVPFFHPQHLRTRVYYQIIISYLDYVKRLGYTWAHVWACPPQENDDYIFHCHPPEQKMPKPKRLAFWYRKLLDYAIIQRVIIDYYDIKKYVAKNNITSVADLPYFHEDYWPSLLEEIIERVEEEAASANSTEQTKVCTEAQDAQKDAVVKNSPEYHQSDKQFGSRSDPTFCWALSGSKLFAKVISRWHSEDPQHNGDTANSIKYPRNRKPSKGIHDSTSTTSRDRDKALPGNELFSEINSAMDKHKEQFLVIKLHSDQEALDLPAIQDPDPLIPCKLMEDRENFLNLARDNNFEFSSLRRVKFSSTALLFELHNWEKERCNYCNQVLGKTFLKCEFCSDFRCCLECGPRERPKHAVEHLGVDIAQNMSSIDKEDTSEAHLQFMENCVELLVHASQCVNLHCNQPNCHLMQPAIAHTKCCQETDKAVCPVCKEMFILSSLHRHNCSAQECPVPFCLQLKQGNVQLSYS